MILMSKDEARNRRDFPWNLVPPKDSDAVFDNGLMLRNVKWLRRGVLQNVRGPRQAAWLMKHMPRWLVEIKGENLKKAVQKMSSTEFLDSTTNIEDEWIEIGLTGN